jgi:hypothetical protein
MPYVALASVSTPTQRASGTSYCTISQSDARLRSCSFGFSFAGRITKNVIASRTAFARSIENFLAVADGGFDATLPEKLLPIEQFRTYFKQNVGEEKTRWDEVANNMSDYYLEVTLSRMEILRQEISFVMHNSDISETEAFELLKRLSSALLMQRNTKRDHDSIKSFLRFFWGLFAGWDFVEGYRARDIVEEMVDSI